MLRIKTARSNIGLVKVAPIDSPFELLLAYSLLLGQV